MEGTGRVDARAAPAQTSVARALVHVAAVLIVHEALEAVVALAEKRPGRVLARAVWADSVGNAALIDVRAVDAFLVDREALGAVAAEATDGVLATAILAQSGKVVALVHFYECIGSHCDITSSFGTQLAIGLSSGSRTCLACVSPGFA